MTYEMFQQGPTVYVPILLLSFGVTLLAYGAFPIIFAKTRKKTITKKKYNLLCYGINFFAMFLFIAFNGKSSGAPYILWTGIFSSIGLRTLKKRGVLDGLQSSMPVSVFQDEDNSGEVDKIVFCRKCGEQLIDGSRFCRKCGTEIVDIQKGID